MDPEDDGDQQTCPNPLHMNKGTTSYAFDIRTELKDYVNNIMSTEDGQVKDRYKVDESPLWVTQRHLAEFQHITLFFIKPVYVGNELVEIKIKTL